MVIERNVERPILTIAAMYSLF